MGGDGGDRGWRGVGMGTAVWEDWVFQFVLLSFLEPLLTSIYFLLTSNSFRQVPLVFMEFVEFVHRLC